MTNSRPKVLRVVAWNTFLTHAAQSLDAEVDDLDPDALLFDLGLDSVSVVELFIALEELGATLPDDVNLASQSLKSLYAACIDSWLST
jgi:acyl carrier protein